MTNLGGYSSLIRLAVANRDFSILQPLSIKDVIWLEVETLRVQEEEEYKQSSNLKFLNDKMDNLYLVLLDTREILRNSNFFNQVSALKESKHPKYNYIEVDKLPSSIISKKREEKSKSKKQKIAEQNDFVRNLVANREKRRKALLKAEGRMDEVRQIEDAEKQKAASVPDTCSI